MTLGRPYLSRTEGSGTVLVMGVLSALLVLVVAVVVLAGASVHAARAAKSADLAALAASDAMRGFSPGEPCALADQVATRHGAQLSSCELASGGIARVSVSVPWSLGVAGRLLPDSRAEARAGPDPRP